MKKIFLSLLIILLVVSCNDVAETIDVENVNCNQQVILSTSNSSFFDDFQVYDVFSIPSEWVSVNEQGLREFMVVSNNGNNFIEMTSFNSNQENKTWLISPKIDFSAMIDKKMSFTLADALQNGNPLKLMYSNDYDGTDCPNLFTWTELGASQIENLINNTQNDDFNFETTGDIDLSNINEIGVVAFVYEGSENGIFTKIQIDDVRIGQSLAYVPNLNISGTIEVGETLTANYSPLIDVQGNVVAAAYQWYRANDSQGTGETEIIGAINSTYQLVNDDSGKYISVKVTVNGNQTTTSYVGVITGLNLPPIAVVNITGVNEVGEILTADTSLTTDAEGDSLTFTYQWYIAEDIIGTGEVEITGEINETYTITQQDSGKFISVKIIANDGMNDSLEASANYIGIPYTNRVFINELADPNNSTRGRFVELYNNANTQINLNGWKLIRYTNGNNTPSSEEQNLVGIIDANSTFVIGKVSDSSTTTPDFISIYGFAPDQAADPHSDGTVNKVVTPIDSNGDDQILLIAPDGTVMDIFGVIGEDGSGTAHEFEDGKAVRKATVIQSNPNWNSNEWDIWNDTGAFGTINLPQNAPADFTPGVR